MSSSYVCCRRRRPAAAAGRPSSSTPPCNPPPLLTCLLAYRLTAGPPAGAQPWRVRADPRAVGGHAGPGGGAQRAAGAPGGRLTLGAPLLSTCWHAGGGGGGGGLGSPCTRGCQPLGLHCPRALPGVGCGLAGFIRWCLRFVVNLCVWVVSQRPAADAPHLTHPLTGAAARVE